jgi:hypothetical protein
MVHRQDRARVSRPLLLRLLRLHLRVSMVVALMELGMALVRAITREGTWEPHPRPLALLKQVMPFTRRQLVPLLLLHQLMPMQLQRLRRRLLLRMLQRGLVQVVPSSTSAQMGEGR